jgi:hypothetical protein
MGNKGKPSPQKPLDRETLMRLITKGDGYRLGPRTGWKKKSQSKKRGQFPAGGLLGTAAIVAVFVGANRE